MSIVGSKVCVVGGAGFLGSHLVNHLVDLDCKVSVLDNLSVGRKEFVNPKARIVVGDITDPNSETLRRAFYKVDYVFNYASMPFIPDCYKLPVDVINVNTLGALRVLEAAHGAGVTRILQVSSAEVYGNSGKEEELLEDQCAMEPVSTYAISKATIDHLAHCRHIETGVPVIILRQFNCVGERETHPYVIPEIINQIHKAEPKFVAYRTNAIKISLGNDTRRDFLYAGDATWMAIELIQKGELGEAYNLGSEKTIGIYELARMICRLMDPDLDLHITEDSSKVRSVDIWSLKSNNKKIYDCINSRPSVPLEEALKRTIDYFNKNNHSWGW